MNTLSVREIASIHYGLVELFAKENDPISPSGVRDQGLLESAVSRQFTGYDKQDKYPEPRDNAAALLYGICMDHPFHNGNKRTALVASLIHLEKNGYMPSSVSHNEFYDLMINLAKHTIHLFCPKETKIITGKKHSFNNLITADDEVSILGCWLNHKTRLVNKGERPITYRRLRQILPKFNCYFGEPNKNFIDVYKKEIISKSIIGIKFGTKEIVSRKCNLSYPGEGAVLPKDSLKKLRRDCDLDLEDGIDSEVFYEDEDQIDRILNDYRNLLKRLSKV